MDTHNNLDSYAVWELLDIWNHRGPPIAEDVRRLFRRDPDSAKKEFLYGQTLLHRCMDTYGDRVELVKVLLEAYPRALLKTDDNGFLPLHRALMSEHWNPNREIVELLISQAPETIISAGPTGALPLHLACRRTNEAVVQYLVDCFPDAVQYRDNDGKFPLNHALDTPDPNDRIVELLVQAYPVLLSFSDDKGRLPLHCSLERHRNLHTRIIEILIDHCPGALRLQDGLGKTPLLQACVQNNPLSQIYSLVRKWPEQVTTQASSIFEEDTFNGEMLPSALASKSTSLDQVVKWVGLYPHVVLSPDLQGRLPIHYAVLSPSDEALDIVRFLLDESGSSSLSVADNHGRLPLHYAAVAGIEATDLLLEVYPEGLLRADEDERLPWHYADCARNDRLYEGMCELYPETEFDLDLVPEEIRWDVIHISSDAGY